MPNRLILFFAISIIAVVSPSSGAKPPKTAKPPTQSVAAWLAKTLGIDPRAYANMTGVRGGEERVRGRRVAELDLATGAEGTLWPCDGCWSPAMAGDDIVVLRDSDDGGPAVWIIPAGGGPPRLAVRVPNAVAILGRTAKATTLALAIDDPACGTRGSAGLRLVEADLRTAAISTPAGAPCLVPPLPSRDRVADNRLTGTTAERDRNGKRVPRRLLVTEPADGAKPVAKRVGSFSDDVDRFDPIWRTASRIVYITNP